MIDKVREATAKAKALRASDSAQSVQPIGLRPQLLKGSVHKSEKDIFKKMLYIKIQPACGNTIIVFLIWGFF